MPVTTRPSFLVITNYPDAVGAEALARLLLEKGLAACINILAPCRSLYHWQGSVQCDQEVPVLIKTTAAHYPLLEATIRQQHPYEVPEIIAFEIAAGLPDYLSWLQASLVQPKEMT